MTYIINTHQKICDMKWRICVCVCGQGATDMITTSTSVQRKWTEHPVHAEI